MPEDFNSWAGKRSDLNRPLADLPQVLSRLSSQLILIQPEEIEQYRKKLQEIHDRIETLLRSV